MIEGGAPHESSNSAAPRRRDDARHSGRATTGWRGQRQLALSNRAAGGGPGHDRAPAAGGVAPPAAAAADPAAFRVYFALIMTAALGLVVGLVAGRGWQGIGPAALVEWWLLCALSNLLPVPAARNIYLSMSSPVNIAIADRS